MQIYDNPQYKFQPLLDNYENLLQQCEYNHEIFFSFKDLKPVFVCLTT